MPPGAPACDRCGSAVASTDSFCPSCGHRLASQPIIASPPLASGLLAVVGAVLVIVGSLGPWVTAQALWVAVSRSGLDGDGRITLGLGVGALVVVAGVLGGVLHGRWFGPRLASLFCGAASLVAIYDLVALNARLADLRAQDTPVYAAAGWGLFGVIAGGLIGAVAAWTLGGESTRMATDRIDGTGNLVAAWTLGGESTRTRAVTPTGAPAARAGRPESRLYPLGRAIAAGTALLLASGIYLFAELSAWLRVVSWFGWGYWLGALAGLLVWLWAVRWLWLHADRRWAMAFFVGSFVALGAYVYSHVQGQTSANSGKRLPKFPTARLCAALVAIAVATVIVAGLADGPGRSYRVDGMGMEPALADGAVLAVGVAPFDTRRPERGDIVVFTPATASDPPHIKRVLGLPGERIAVRDGAVYVNDARLEEPYLDDPITPCDGDVTCSVLVPDGHVYVLADNRTTSLEDSRSFGPIAVERIVGKVEGIVWPPGDVGRLPRVEYVENL